MAGVIPTINQGVSTEDILSDERVIDMDDKIRVLKPDDTQFTTMTDRLGTTQAVREKVNWLEEEDFPRIISNTSSQLSTDTAAIPFAAGQGKLVQANDLIRNMRTGEAARVTVVATDALTLARGISSATGGVAAAAMNANDSWLVVADAQPQGSDFPTPRYLQRVLGYNFTQITRTPWTFNGTTVAIELYGGREPAKEAKRQGRVHKKKWEAIGFWGARSFTASSSGGGGNNEPQGTAGGAVEFVAQKYDCLGAQMTADFFDKMLMDVMQYGSQNKVLFASPLVTYSMARWNRSGMGSQWEPTPENVHGVHVDAFISGAYGYRIPVVVKKEFGEFPTANGGYGTYAFLLDMDYIVQRPLRDRDTKLLVEQQPKGRDTYSAEYIREATYEFAHPRAHTILFNMIP